MAQDQSLAGTAWEVTGFNNGRQAVVSVLAGTSLTAIFNQPPSADRDAVFAAIRERYAQLGVTTMPRLGFNNSFAVLVRGDDAARRQLRTIGDVNRFDGARAGFGYEFLERPDGFPGLRAAYSLRISGQPRTMDLNLIYRALAAGEIVTTGTLTDAWPIAPGETWESDYGDLPVGGLALTIR